MKLAEHKTPITIGIFSSSSPVSVTASVRYERGKVYLESKGFGIVDGSLYKQRDFYRSGTINERAEEMCIRDSHTGFAHHA